MPTVVYHLVPHDGGWAYKVDDSFSEPFSTRDAARAAAERAAREQHEPGDTVHIVYEDSAGRWHAGTEQGTDRPETRVDE